MKRQKRCAVLMTILALTIHAGVFAADILDGLVGYWPFDEGEGDAAHDLVGGHDGSIKRAAWTDRAKSGRWALQFSPEDDTKVVIPDAEELDNLPDGHSVTNWIWPVSRGAMMDKSDKVNRIQWYILEEDPGWRFHWGGGSGFTFSPFAANWGEWHHCAWVHTASASTAYLDGVAIHTEPDMGPIILTTEPMYFGDMGILAAGNPKQQNFEGVLDEFHIWNRALSAEEIMQFLQGGGTAVSPKGKLAITWADLKASD